MREVKIAPSILSCDFLHLSDEISKINSSSCELIHYDVMDGKFVPELSYGEVVLRAMKKEARKPFDVHLMTVEPYDSIKSFAEAGADSITVHFEACKDLQKNIDRIHEFSLPAAVSIKPSTPVEVLFPYLKELQMVLLMTVNPGFGGQPFLDGSLERIALLKNEIMRQKLDIDIEVDGGINMKTVSSAYHAGANVFVSGSALFKGDLVRNVEDMKALL